MNQAAKARLVEQMGDTGLQQNSISALKLETDVPVSCNTK